MPARLALRHRRRRPDRIDAGRTGPGRFCSGLRRVDWRGGDQRGETSVELVILIPVVVLLVLLSVQAAIFYHAGNVAQAAESHGAAVGAPRGVGSGAASAAAEQLVRESGSVPAGVTAAADSRQVTVTVAVEVAHIVPFFPHRVSRTFVEPRERFIPEDER